MTSNFIGGTGFGLCARLTLFLSRLQPSYRAVANS